jgi:xanthine dehydrogenase YagR molybdenum-binding subunit
VAPLLGLEIDRADGRAKVTGAARYAAEHPVDHLAYAVLVTSAIAKGRIAQIDTRDALEVPGVLAVMTYHNAPRLEKAGATSTPGRPPSRALSLLQGPVIRYANEPIAVVVADTLEAARDAAQRVAVRYAPDVPNVALDAARSYTPAQAGRPDQTADTRRGDAVGVWSGGDVHLEQLYATPFETHNAMEPHATIALWQGPARLVLYDATQGVFGCRQRVAEILGLRLGDVRVISPFLGGGFGSKGPTWSHTLLAAMAAKQVSRPVKLVLTRPQMVGPVGWRSRTQQRIAASTGRDGRLESLRHDTLAHTSTFDEFMESASMPSRMLYACPHRSTSHRLVRSDIGTPSYMRAPGWAPGTYALECAMDELAYSLEVDPVELRLRNYAERDPDKDRPWSSNYLRECYRAGAERFGWERRSPRPRAMREGSLLIGWGMASSVYPTHRSGASALVRLSADGAVRVECGTQDLGTGTYTILGQIAADALGVGPDRVMVGIGDTLLPQAPVSGGSQTAASAGSAVHLAAVTLRNRLAQLAASDSGSPLAGVPPDDIGTEAGRLFARQAPQRAETFQALLARQGRGDVEARVDAVPGDEHDRYSMYAFGAQFAEVRVDADLGQVQVSRMVGVFDIGRAINGKTAASQLKGGMVWGIGLALYEESVLDERLGRVVNANFAEYHIPVQTDVPAIDVAWIDASDDRANPIGAKGIGELGITGAAAAVANAVYHATGRRVRELPITLDKLL